MIAIVLHEQERKTLMVWEAHTTADQPPKSYAREWCGMSQRPYQLLCAAGQAHGYALQKRWQIPGVSAQTQSSPEFCLQRNGLLKLPLF